MRGGTAPPAGRPGGLPGVGLLTLVLLALLALGACGETPSAETRTALEDGNRLFRSGQLESALETYRAGWNPRRPNAQLAYNLATTAHHLDRLPEAVLWYRRALAADPGDRWLAENLALAREQLATAPTPPPGPLARLGRHRPGLLAVAAGLAWLALGLLLAGPRRWADGCGLAALVLLLAGLAIPHLAPVPAVVLEDCGTAGPRAGEEVWVPPSADPEAEPGGAVSVLTAGRESRCPASALALVRP